MRDENCIFCKILAGEIPSTAVYEDDDFKAIIQRIEENIFELKKRLSENK